MSFQRSFKRNDKMTDLLRERICRIRAKEVMISVTIKMECMNTCTGKMEIQCRVHRSMLATTKLMLDSKERMMTKMGWIRNTKKDNYYNNSSMGTLK